MIALKAISPTHHTEAIAMSAVVEIEGVEVESLEIRMPDEHIPLGMLPVVRDIPIAQDYRSIVRELASLLDRWPDEVMIVHDGHETEGRLLWDVNESGFRTAPALPVIDLVGSLDQDRRDPWDLGAYASDRGIGHDGDDRDPRVMARNIASAYLDLASRRPRR